MIIEKPAISIIIPVYNTLGYLERCIDSILNQTYKNYEILLIDDGSIDESRDLCEEYAASYKNIRFFHQENSGPGVARNRGIKESKGDLIIFCDSDDFWNTTEQDFLSEIIQVINNNPDIDIIAFNGYYYYGENKKVEISNYSCFAQVESLYNSGLSFIKTMLEIKADFKWFPVFYVFRKSLFIKNHIKFPKYLHCEDAATLYKLFIEARQTAIINRFIYFYSQERTDSCTNNESISVLLGNLDVTEKCINDIETRDLPHDIKKLLLNNFATLYFMVMIHANRLNKQDRNELINNLKAKNYIMNYAFSTKQAIARRLVRLFGYKATVILLDVRRKIKDRYIKNEKLVNQ